MSNISVQLVKEFQDQVKAFAKEISQGNLPETNLLEIQAKYVKIFTENLVLGGLPKTTAKRIAKHTASENMNEIMHTIQ